LPAATVTTPELVSIAPTESVLELNAYVRVGAGTVSDVAVAVKIVSPSAFEFSAIAVGVITPSAPPSAVPGEDQSVITASAMCYPTCI